MFVAMYANLVSIGENLSQQIGPLRYLAYENKKSGLRTMPGEAFQDLRRYAGRAVIKCDRDSSSMLAN